MAYLKIHTILLIMVVFTSGAPITGIETSSPLPECIEKPLPGYTSMFEFIYEMFKAIFSSENEVDTSMCPNGPSFSPSKTTNDVSGSSPPSQSTPSWIIGPLTLLTPTPIIHTV